MVVTKFQAVPSGTSPETSCSANCANVVSPVDFSAAASGRDR